MSKNNVKLLLVTPYFPPHPGGLENYAFNIAQGLAQTHGYEVVVVTSNPDGKQQIIENYRGLKVYRLPILLRISNTPLNPGWYFTIKRIIRAEKPDLINAHQPVPFIGDVTALLAGHIPFVLTYHSGTMQKKKFLFDILVLLYEKLILPYTASKATRIICASHFVKNTILKKYRSKCAVIQPGVDLSLFKPNPAIKKEENLIVFICRYKNMHKMKGLYYLLEAMKFLPQVRLRIIGEKAAFADQRIVAAGVKTGADLVEELQKASLVVLPSLAHMESFGMALIEAMACSTPVVGTNIGGIPEVIADGIDGFLVPSNDSQALALAIAKVMADKDLATRMGLSGAAKVREEFTWTTRIALTQEVFASCLERPDDGRPQGCAPTPTIVQVTSYYPPHLGGMENVAAQITEGLTAKGYAVAVYTSDRGYSSNTVNSSKSPVHYLKSIEFAHTPIMFSLFFRLLALPRHALIHLHVSQAFSPEIVYLVSRLRGIAYIAHIHLDVDASGPFGFLLAPYKKIFLKRVLKSAAKVICLSEPQRQLIARQYALPLESIVVIPNGVAQEYFVGARTHQNPVPRLLFVGRLAAQKNLALLIETCAQMQVQAFLDIVGEGEERAKIEALIQQYRLQNVKLHGRKTGQELIELYRSADMFVLPSLKEGVSLSMLEAMAAGLPVVASDAPEIRHILGECGVLIQEPTATNYASALDATLSNKDIMRKLSMLSTQKARAYSWRKLLDALEEVYKEASDHAIR